MKPCVALAPPDPVLDQLLERLDKTIYWTEHLVLTADLVGGTIVGIVQKQFPGGLQDVTVFQFLSEEAKCSASQLGDIYDELAEHLRKTFPEGKPHG